MASPPQRPERPVSLQRRLLGAPAIWLHRLALTLVRALPAPRSRARPAPGGGPRPVRIILANAYGMGGTIRTTFNLAGRLARGREVEIIALKRHTKRPFFDLPGPPRIADPDPGAPNADTRAALQRMMRISATDPERDEELFVRGLRQVVAGLTR